MDGINMVSKIIHTLQVYLLLPTLEMSTFYELTVLFSTFYFLQVLVVKVIIPFCQSTIEEGPLLLYLSFISNTTGALGWAHEK